MAERAQRDWPALDVVARPDTRLPDDFEEQLLLLLDDLEATALESDAARHRWRVHFHASDHRDRAATVLASGLPGVVEILPILVPDEGWVYKVQEQLRAVRVGRIVVAPPWDIPSGEQRPVTGDEDVVASSQRPVAGCEPAASRQIVIVIEPSMGFGTGHHQSTRLCLAALQALSPDGVRVVDVGTGSGVLAIAARKLGAASVLAFDNDADSVDSARDNASRNSIEVDGHQFAVVLAELSSVATTPVDVVVANLTAWVIRQEARGLSALLSENGRMVISGFTHDQVALVMDSLPGLVIERRLEEDDWVALVLRRETSLGIHLIG